MLLLMNLTLYLTSSLSDGSGNGPLSLFINPIITMMISSLFPLFLLNSQLPVFFQQNEFFNFIIDCFLKLLVFIDHIDPFPIIKFSTVTLTISAIFLVYNKRKLFTLVLCCSISPIHTHQSISNNKDIIVNLGDPTEFLYKKKEWLHFVDQKCKIEDTQIFCKNKSTRFGGPTF